MNLSISHLTRKNKKGLISVGYLVIATLVIFKMTNVITHSEIGSIDTTALPPNISNMLGLKKDDKVKVAEGIFTLSSNTTITVSNGLPKKAGKPYVDVSNPVWTNNIIGIPTYLCFKALTTEIICFEPNKGNEQHIQAYRQESDNKYYSYPLTSSNFVYEAAVDATVTIVEGNGAFYGKTLDSVELARQFYIGTEPEQMDYHY